MKIEQVLIALLVIIIAVLANGYLKIDQEYRQLEHSCNTQLVFKYNAFDWTTQEKQDLFDIAILARNEPEKIFNYTNSSDRVKSVVIKEHSIRREAFMERMEENYQAKQNQSEN